MDEQLFFRSMKMPKITHVELLLVMKWGECNYNLDALEKITNMPKREIRGTLMKFAVYKQEHRIW